LVPYHPFSKIRAVLSQNYVRTTILANQTLKIKNFILFTKITLVPPNIFCFLKLTQ
jgi:hypothetical protein